jgi:hypothetical protein
MLAALPRRHCQSQVAAGFFLYLLISFVQMKTTVRHDKKGHCWCALSQPETHRTVQLKRSSLVNLLHNAAPLNASSTPTLLAPAADKFHGTAVKARPPKSALQPST